MPAGRAGHEPVARFVCGAEGTRAGIIERIGRYHRTLGPGRYFLTPYLDRVRATVDLREQVIAMKPELVIAQDNLVAIIEGVLYLRVTDALAAIYEVNDYRRAAELIAITAMRTALVYLTAENARTSLDAIADAIRAALDTGTANWGFTINRVEIKPIGPPITLKEAKRRQAWDWDAR